MRELAGASAGRSLSDEEEGTSYGMLQRRPSYADLEAQSNELRLTNALLLQQQAFMRTVADNVPARVAYWKRDGTCGYVNQQYCEWSGRRREELVGKTLDAIFGAERLEKTRPQIAAAMAGQPQDFEMEAENADGSLSTTWLHYVPDTHDGVTRGYLAVASEVSMSKKADLRLQLLNRAKTAAKPRLESQLSGSRVQALHEAVAEDYRSAGPTPMPTAAFEALRSTQVGARVLLVEDNEVNQEVGRELLRSAGLEVDIAADGEEAVSLALASAYDLVLMDVQMPKVDGLQATRLLRQRPATRTLPIVAMTVGAYDEDRAACLAAGMDDHIGKPFEPEALYAKLIRWLPHRPSGPPAGVAPRPKPSLRKAASLRSSERLAQLASVEGLDVVGGLELCRGDSDFYLSALSTFATVYAEGLPRSEPSLGDSHTTVEAAHSLRSASGSIGALAIAREAAAVEALGRSGPVPAEMAKATSALQHRLAVFVRQLERSFDASAARPLSQAPENQP